MYKRPTVIHLEHRGNYQRTTSAAEQHAGIRANMGERWVCWGRATRCPRPCGVWGGASGVSSRGAVRVRAAAQVRVAAQVRLAAKVRVAAQEGRETRMRSRCNDEMQCDASMGAQRGGEFFYVTYTQLGSLNSYEPSRASAHPLSSVRRSVYSSLRWM